MNQLIDSLRNLLSSRKREAVAVVPVSQEKMVSVFEGILDRSKMDDLAAQYGARRGMNVSCIGNVLLGDDTYDPLRGLTARTYVVSAENFKAFNAAAKIAENAGQPLDYEIVAIPEANSDPLLLSAVNSHYEAQIIQGVSLRKCFWDRASNPSNSTILCAVPKSRADAYKNELSSQGQFALSF